ncbi:MAG: hypothetical protein CO149_01380 [Nitrospirae bacterium CG_4_9_14_3_um_filter_51_5]|nr:MAG: hypothetical protein CO149_01380 [Nitrospirae bacterium CG_4_9_14_3_um_filter_51_5]
MPNSFLDEHLINRLYFSSKVKELPLSEAGRQAGSLVISQIIIPSQSSQALHLPGILAWAVDHTE